MRRAALIAVLVVIAQALLVPLFAGPASHLAPRDLPLAVAGSPTIAAQLEQTSPGAFDVVTVADAAAADAAIRSREVYGAVVVTAAGPEVHVATAASPTVAALLTQAAARFGPAVPVRDVVPLPAGDPRGAGFGAAFLPMAMTGMLAGVLIALALRGRTVRLVALGAFAVLAGAVGATVQQGWLGVLPGDHLAVAGVLALFAAAVAGAVAGLGALLGKAGPAIGAVVIFLIGNALSGVSAAPELLPQPWGALGQWLPIGAGGQALRSVAYFDGSGAGGAVTVLAAYAIVGVVLIVIGGRKRAAEAEPAQDVAVAAVPETAGAR